MTLIIELAENNPDPNGNIVANYRDNSGDDVDADIKVYVNSVYRQTISVLAKIQWQAIPVLQLVSAPGQNVNVRVEIMESGSAVVNLSDNKYYSNYKIQTP